MVAIATTGVVLVTRQDSRPAAPPGRASIDGVTLVADAASPIGLVALADGGFRYGERRSGAIREVDPNGRLRSEPVAQVDVVADPGQRGLLGLSVDRRNATFAAWTRADDGHLVVGQVAPGPIRLVWRGPASADLANGGHLVVAPDGRLVIGVGDLQDPARLDDPSAPNGKLLSLDPAGPPDQRPRVLSSGWNNPFAFTFLADGSLWVADNAPGKSPERIGRGDGDGRPRRPLPGKRAPSALVTIGPGRLGLCGFLDGVLREVRVDRDRAEDPGPAVVGPCLVGAARLADGRLVVASEDRITVTR